MEERRRSRSGWRGSMIGKSAGPLLQGCVKWLGHSILRPMGQNSVKKVYFLILGHDFGYIDIRAPKVRFARRINIQRGGCFAQSSPGVYGGTG